MILAPAGDLLMLFRAVFSVLRLLLSYHFAGTLAIASSAKKPAVARAAAAAAAVPATKSSGGFMFFGIRNNLWKAVRLRHPSGIHC